MRKAPYPHPGEILLEEFLKPLGVTQSRVAKEIGVSQRRIGEIVAGMRSVAAKSKDALAKTLSNIKPWGGAKPRSAHAA